MAKAKSSGRPKKPGSRDLLRVTQAAEELNVSRSHIYRMMKEGRLSYVLLGKSRRIPATAIDELIERNLTVSTI